MTTVVTTAITDVLVFEPQTFVDARGFFFEVFNERVFTEATGGAKTFVQDNQSYSHRAVVRGLHYQIQRPQGKLVRAVVGEIFDVAVDIRRRSPTFGSWVGVTLSAENRRQLWIPPGFAHGFSVLSTDATVIYKVTDYWIPEFDRTIVWNDPTIAVEWPLTEEPILSARDRAAGGLDGSEFYE